MTKGEKQGFEFCWHFSVFFQLEWGVWFYVTISEAYKKGAFVVLQGMP
jgi:hypothetical protein